MEKEYQYLFDWLKQLTTLDAGSIVLIGTFLQGIFPSKDGTLTVGIGIKLLIAAAFLLFGLSLAVSVLSMGYITRKIREKVEPSTETTDTSDPRPLVGYEHGEWLLLITFPLICFVLALASFGRPILINLF